MSAKSCDTQNQGAPSKQVKNVEGSTQTLQVMTHQIRGQFFLCKSEISSLFVSKPHFLQMNCAMGHCAAIRSQAEAYDGCQSKTWAGVCDGKRREERAFPCGCRLIRADRAVLLIAHGGSHPNISSILEMLPRKERLQLRLHFFIHALVEHLVIRPFRRTPTGLEDS